MRRALVIERGRERGEQVSVRPFARHVGEVPEEEREIRLGFRVTIEGLWLRTLDGQRCRSLSARGQIGWQPR